MGQIWLAFSISLVCISYRRYDVEAWDDHGSLLSTKSLAVPWSVRSSLSFVVYDCIHIDFCFKITRFAWPGDWRCHRNDGWQRQRRRPGSRDLPPMDRWRTTTVWAYPGPARHDAIRQQSRSTISSASRIADEMSVTDEGNNDVTVEFFFKDILKKLELDRTLHWSTINRLPLWSRCWSNNIHKYFRSQTPLTASSR